ncbi:hypothetical protein KR018_011364 [Drosophila ironensis]|nr:hypothetical protein KR018_011364 [Drosophila ironensis]
MPICKREGFDLNEGAGRNDTFHDNDLVFCCYITKRIFRDYEDYFRHVMVINSTVWQCEATGKDNLTYEEALKSERAARKKMEQFKPALRAPVLMVVEHARQSAKQTLNLLVAKFLRKRYFIGEEVSVVGRKKTLYTVQSINPDKKVTEPANGIYEETEELEYRLRPIKDGAVAEITVPFSQIRRQRLEFNMENLNMFVKNHVTRVDGILRPKPEAYKQYVTGPGVTFSSIFIGKMPRYSPSKIKKPEPKDAKKQSTLNKFIVPDEESAAKSKAKAKADAKSLAEEMERIRVEKLERLRLEKLARFEERERERAAKRAQLVERVESECDLLLQKSDDLERTDQRMLPLYRQVVTLLPDSMLGDAFMIREFMHTYQGLLSGIDVFRNNLSFYEMTRALHAREVAGPLSDILMVLLGTIFDLQKEEEEECNFSYLKGWRGTPPVEPYLSMFQAARCHDFAKRHFSFKINQLPIDALTLTEVLRLHLLSSGANVTEKAERWRIMYRNGYTSRGDPGLELRMRQGRILRMLKNHPIYKLKFADIIAIIQCLMAQILTYSGTINLIEERMEEMMTAKHEIRALMSQENKRLAALEVSKKKLTQRMQPLINTAEPDGKQALVDEMDKGIAELNTQSDHDHRAHLRQLNELNSRLFNFLVYLGTDRCYRKYYVLESMPGIFVEHSPDIQDTCLEKPPLNRPPSEIKQIEKMPRNRRDLQRYLQKLYVEEEKKSRPNTKQSQENKENQEHRVNGTVEPMEVATEADPPEAAPTQFDLMMCSGDKRNCIVHDPKNSQRQRWSYICQEDEIDALLQGLNPQGFRESELHEQLSSLRSLIVEHVKSCPTTVLDLSNATSKRKFQVAMHAETHRRYDQANMGLPEGTDLNDVMRIHLTDRLIQFERNIFTGDLGRLKVKDMEKWRDDLLAGRYDPQAKLQWGPREDDVANGSEEKESHEDVEEEDDDDKSGASVGKNGKNLFVDPGMHVNIAGQEPGEDIETDEEPIPDLESAPEEVHNLASALLQIEQAIGKRFFKEPYGMKKWDPTKESQRLIRERRLQLWEQSLMEATSYSQVFLHLNILDDCIQWTKSTNKSMCSVCRRGGDADKMLLCDECNAGTHMFCMKPKMRTVPEGDWYCKECVASLGLKNQKKDKKAAKKKRKFIVEEEDEQEDDVEPGEEDQEAEEGAEEEDDGEDAKSVVSSTSSARSLGKVNQRASDSTRKSKRLRSKEIEAAAQEDTDSESETSTSDCSCINFKANLLHSEEKVCEKCFYDGSEVRCGKCQLYYHLECVNLKRMPRTEFVCKQCKTTETQRPRRRHSHMNGDDDDDDKDEPQSKRSRSSRNLLSLSLDKSNGPSNNNNNSSTHNNNNHRRSGRRTNESLPLNSAALYELLEQVMKHQAAWPFLRPVLPSEVPDYHDIIKNPMDLAKIKSKLNMGQYQLNEELLNDIQLVFRNCDRYNVEGNEIYDAGCQLERFVIDRCRDMQLPFRPSGLNLVC